METDDKYRKLPSVDKVLSNKRLKEIRQEFSHETVVDITRRYIEELRGKLGDGMECPSLEEVVDEVESEIRDIGGVSPRPVINATGVIIHTNLGRAPLSTESIAAMKEASEGYCDLEIDLDTGKRGSRNAHVERKLCQITGAEDALVVNNNASAVLLALSALARRKEVIVSRGHAVEIGGKFRIPDVMRQSGAKLVEVGTTNKTYISDYQEAVTERTAALLRVHSSNFSIVGFTEEVELADMVELARRHELNVIDDLGSGCFLDTEPFGLGREPTVQESVAAGAGVATFSGDKLLGGPQAGIIVGRKRIVERLKKHPLARAVRIDKTRLAGLSATLIHYLKGEAVTRIPVWQMIGAPAEQIRERAERWAGEIGGGASLVKGESTVGGGSVPGSTLPTWLVVIKTPGHAKVQDIARRMRLETVPVAGRIEKNNLILDPRSVPPREDAAVIATMRNVFSG
ncbi:MAG: L-seryl-tRNA(Sec) selenium transferase [Dehalococcoidia bacterium]